jgi:tetratricopeptide (TPR) repeat protein
MCRLRLTTALLALALFAPAAVACLWDHDTLMQERSRFPTALELITGKFLRHSPEFYEWRVQDRLKKLEADPKNLSYQDDLAVAYEKLGRHDKAIEVMLAAGAQKPDRYETEANLGTFYIHAGQLETGLAHIDHALRINPDAHFGREKYQKLLVEYLLGKPEADRTRLPLAERVGSNEEDFAGFVGKRLGTGRPKGEARQTSVKGVLGMMRFGNWDSPVLLEALARLLGTMDASPPEDDAKRLAARAYLKASYAVTDSSAKAGYRKLAEQVLTFQTRTRWRDDALPLRELETSFRRELDEAEAWYEELRRNEVSWIREGKDPEAEFARLYGDEPVLRGPEWEEPRGYTRRLAAVLLTASVLAASLCLLLRRTAVRRPGGGTS